MNDAFLAPFERLLGDLFPPDRVRAIDAGGVWDSEWAELEASGYLDALTSEDGGGAGLSADLAVALWRALGRYAAPLAIGETMIERAGLGKEWTALLLAAAMSGAADRALAMSVDHANQRMQFGKPIGRQQAVQQQLAVMAEDCVAMRLAAEMAAAAMATGPLPAAVAKSVASSAAPRIAATAHAVHGAIGISAEYDLQLFAGRLHAWRTAEGSEALWNRRIGKALLDEATDTLDFVRGRLFGAADG